jgi:Na+-transporting NADH:ubiquinone oxidoreductase subunit C
MKNSAYTLVFAATLGAVCAIVLAVPSEMLEPYRRANMEADKVRTILGVLGVPVEKKASSQQLLDSFRSVVKEERRGTLSLYRYLRDEETVAVAVPFSGPGVWGPVEGFLSLSPDLRTVRGITFHKHEETPGLGGEIVSERFRKQFIGKTLESISGKAGIRIRPPNSPLADNEVHAITGATMTCNKVEAMLTAVIQHIKEEQNENVK